MPATTSPGKQESLVDGADKSTGSGSKGRDDKDRKFRYVDCDLTTDQKNSLRYWRENDADPQALLEWLDRMVVNGHTISLKSEEVGFAANVTGVRPSSGHVDMCLNARASTASNALFAVMYKDEELLRGQWAVKDRKAELDL